MKAMNFHRSKIELQFALPYTYKYITVIRRLSNYSLIKSYIKLDYSSLCKIMFFACLLRTLPVDFNKAFFKITCLRSTGGNAPGHQDSRHVESSIKKVSIVTIIRISLNTNTKGPLHTNVQLISIFEA